MFWINCSRWNGMQWFEMEWNGTKVLYLCLVLKIKQRYPPSPSISSLSTDPTIAWVFSPLRLLYCRNQKVYLFDILLYFSWWQHAANLASYEQQDAHEFFISMLDGIHEKVEKDRRKPHSEGNVFWQWQQFILFTFYEVLSTPCVYYYNTIILVKKNIWIWPGKRFLVWSHLLYYLLWFST